MALDPPVGESYAFDTAQVKSYVESDNNRRFYAFMMFFCGIGLLGVHVAFSLAAVIALYVLAYAGGTVNTTLFQYAVISKGVLGASTLAGSLFLLGSSARLTLPVNAVIQMADLKRSTPDNLDKIKEWFELFLKAKG